MQLTKTISSVAYEQWRILQHVNLFIELEVVCIPVLSLVKTTFTFMIPNLNLQSKPTDANIPTFFGHHLGFCAYFFGQQVISHFNNQVSLVLSIFQLQNIQSLLSQELTTIKSSIFWTITSCILFKISLKHGVL
jgi:hypothetical protein